MTLRRTVVLPILALCACAAPQAPEREDGDAEETADGEQPETVPAPGPAECASPSIARWVGAAARDNTSGYPDHISATVTWSLVDSDGCVDIYTQTGSATYRHDIPGALCTQSIAPDTAAVAGSDGTLTVDRTTSPATYRVNGATTWTVTWTCDLGGGEVEEMQLEGGGTWVEAAGTVDGATIAGTDEVADDDARCGPEGIAPCAFQWSFAAAE